MIRLLILLGLLLPAGIFLEGCTSSPETLRARLEEIGASDLKDILAELPPQAKATAMLPRPTYVVDEFQEFHGDTARVYQARASLVFFYLDPSLDLCQIRKYRFKTSSGIWDRYDVKLKHIPRKFIDTTSRE
jgi:hypothetical protein